MQRTQDIGAPMLLCFLKIGTILTFFHSFHRQTNLTQWIIFTTCAAELVLKLKLLPFYIFKKSVAKIFAITLPFSADSLLRHILDVFEVLFFLYSLHIARTLCNFLPFIAVFNSDSRSMQQIVKYLLYLTICCIDRE